MRDVLHSRWDRSTSWSAWDSLEFHGHDIPQTTTKFKLILLHYHPVDGVCGRVYSLSLLLYASNSWI